VVVIGWAAITSGNGPHSSLASLLFQGYSAVVLGHPERDPLGYPERIVTGRVIFPSPSHQYHSTERNMVSSAERKVLKGAILLPRVQTGCSSPFLRPSSPKVDICLPQSLFCDVWLVRHDLWLRSRGRRTLLLPLASTQRRIQGVSPKIAIGYTVYLKGTGQQVRSS